MCIRDSTETGLSVTYEDSDNTLDFVLADSTITFSGDVAGSATQTAKGAITVGNMNITAPLNQMTDVNYTSSPTAGQILTWDAGNNYWEPANNSTTTDTTSEGTNNKYFTDDRVNSVVQAGNGLSKTFNGGSTVLDGTSTLSVATSNGVKLDGNDVELDYSVITDSDLTGGLPSGSGKAVGHLYFLV